MSNERRPSALACDNESGHEVEPLPPAIFRVEFPEGRWNACTPCRDCFDDLVSQAHDEGLSVLLLPVAKGSFKTGDPS